MSTLSSANVTDVNLVLKERTHMRLCLNMLIFTHNLGNWLNADRCMKAMPTNMAANQHRRCNETNTKVLACWHLSRDGNFHRLTFH